MLFKRYKNWLILEGILNYLRGVPISFKQPYADFTIKSNLIYKSIKPQKFPDYIKRAFNSQAKREAYSARYLNSIGLNTPKIYGYGININPFIKYDSILVMEYIKDSITLFEWLKKESNKKRAIKRE